MPSSPDYPRRRIIVAAILALLIAVPAHETPVIGTLSVDMDDDLVPKVSAEWSPPLAAAIHGVTQAAALVAAIVSR